MANGNPALGAALGNAPGMYAIAGGAVGAAGGLCAALDAISDNVYRRRYESSLERAVRQANELDAVAREAIAVVQEQSNEIARLKRLLEQRQGYINRLAARRSAAAAA